MEFFLDTANIETIRQLLPTGLIDGVTTNPTHLSNEEENPTAIIQQLCAMIPNGKISVEVTELDPANMYVQAKKIAALAPNIIVKIPCAQEYFPVIKQLTADRIPTNITLVCSLSQGLAVAKLGATYISAFVGRLDDFGENGISVVQELTHAKINHRFSSKILAASIRSVEHVTGAMLAGADAITMPTDVFTQMLIHPLTTKGIEKFNHDWKRLDITQFP